MAKLRPVMLTFVLVCLSSIAWMTSSTDSAHGSAFIQCLSNYSQDSNSMSNSIYTPNTASYTSMLQSRINNLRFNTSATPKPFLIFSPTSEPHVQAAVICARKHGLRMTIRSGGHDYEALSYASNVPFFMLDMYNLRSIDVDMASKTAWVHAGATLGEVYYRIAKKSKTHGFPGGVSATVGVGGHITGGGYGTMMRKYGLSVDNIEDAKLVDANGRLLDRKSMGEDLFWAIRGGGGASFGVLIAFKIKLVSVPEIVTVFQVERTLEQSATDIIDQWQHVAFNLDPDICIRVFLKVQNSSNRQGENTISANFRTLFLGDSERLLSMINASFPKLGLRRSDCFEMSWLEAVLFFADIPLGTPTNALLSRKSIVLAYFKHKSDYVQKPIPREGLEGIWKKMMELQVPTLEFSPMGAKMAEIPASSTPFPHRAGNLWNIQYMTNWKEDGEEAAEHHINLSRQLYAYMTPFVSKNPRAQFFNYKDLDLGINHHGRNSYMEGRAYGIKYFKENFDRLVKIKTVVDPDDFFTDEHGIPTAPQWRM